jgi:hypothetical protein
MKELCDLRLACSLWAGNGNTDDRRFNSRLNTRIEGGLDPLQVPLGTLLERPRMLRVERRQIAFH